MVLFPARILVPGYGRHSGRQEKLLFSYRPIADRFEKNDRLAIAITPEATRKPNPDWKLGFYYTALKAQVPIVLAYIDYKDKQIGLTQSIIPSGNVEKEMTEIKNFYRNRQGKHPENFVI